MTASGESEDDFATGAFSWAVSVEEDVKWDAVMSGALDWAPSTATFPGEGEHDLGCWMMVTDQGSEALYVGGSLDGSEGDGNVTGAAALNVRVDEGEPERDFVLLLLPGD